MADTLYGEIDQAIFNSLLGSAGGVGAGTVSAGVGTIGNTAGSTGQIASSSPSIVFAALGALSASQSSNGGSATISFSAPAQTVQPIGTGSFGVGTIGNTAGSTGQITGTSPSVVFAALGALSASQSSNGASATISLSAPAQTVQPIGTGTFGMSNLGSTAGTSGTITGTSPSVLFVATNGMMHSQSINGSSATISIQQNWLSTYANEQRNLTWNQQGTSIWVHGIYFPQPMRLTGVNFWGNVSSAVTTTTTPGATGGQSLYFQLFTRSGTTLSNIASGSSAFTISISGADVTSLCSGKRNYSIALGSTAVVQPGFHYVALAGNSSSAIAISFAGYGLHTNAGSGNFGSPTNTAVQVGELGVWTAATASSQTTVSIAYTDLIDVGTPTTAPAILFVGT